MSKHIWTSINKIIQTKLQSLKSTFESSYLWLEKSTFASYVTKQVQLCDLKSTLSVIKHW